MKLKEVEDLDVCSTMGGTFLRGMKLDFIGRGLAFYRNDFLFYVLLRHPI
jgi:hypothetical protein